MEATIQTSKLNMSWRKTCKPSSMCYVEWPHYENENASGSVQGSTSILHTMNKKASMHGDPIG